MNAVCFDENEGCFVCKVKNYEIRILECFDKYSVTFFEFKDSYLIPCFDMSDFTCRKETEKDGCDYNINECPDRIPLKNAELTGLNSFEIKEGFSKKDDIMKIKENILRIAKGLWDVDYSNSIKKCNDEVTKILEGSWSIYGMEI